MDDSHRSEQRVPQHGNDPRPAELPIHRSYHDRGEFTVGWICAVVSEYVAAQVFLDEEYEAPEDLAPGNKNNYTLGRMGNHKVVIAVLPIGEYGTSSAARVADDMLHSFPNIRIGLMVGIGGGVPTRHDIRLGDIVVSVPSNGLPGVLEYDFGKTIQSQSFQLTGILNQPPVLLRTAVSALKAQYEIKGHQLDNAINGVLAKNRRLWKKYKRPNSMTDRLYRSEITHPIGAESDCTMYCGDRPSSLVRRDARDESDDNPMVHYGQIASANQLMKDATVRDKLAAEKDISCFEMEASGLVNHFPSLIIRGVCDYSDSHKNKEWQGYAAMAAVSYAKDLLGRITPQQIQAERKITETLKDIQHDIRQLSAKVDGIVDKQQDSEQQRILAWLTPLEFASLQNDLINRKQEGTLEWLFSSPEYLEWENIKGRALFCPGIPGAGKTMTSAIVIDHLRGQFRSETNAATIFVYCNFRRHEEQQPIDLFSALLKQFSQQQPTLPTRVKDLYEKHQINATRPSLKEVSKTLEAVLKDRSKTFIIIDALDEYRSYGRAKFLSGLLGIANKAGANLFATSRFIPDIEKVFAKNNALVREIRAFPEDIYKYIDHHIDMLPSFVATNHDLQNKIKEDVVKAANGMFLLAQLHLGILAGKRSPKAIKTALENLRTGTEAYDYAYNEAMERIKSQPTGVRDLAMEALAWVTLARRPLSTTELLHALAVEPESSIFDDENISDISYVVSQCAGLVSVDRESDIVRLVHYTAQEYFQKTKDKWFAGSQDMLTRACVAYLNFNAFDTGACRERDLNSRLALYPLLAYASLNWGHHAALSSIDGHDLVLKLLENTNHVSVCNQVMMSERHSLNFYDYSRMTFTGIHLAAYFGLVRSMSELLARQHGLNVKDDYGLTPLSWASRNGHANVVELLLEKGVSLDLPDSRLRTPLFSAALCGHTSVLGLLIDHGADVSFLAENGMTPLCYAIAGGQEAACRVLLDRKADVNIQYGSRGRSPLMQASAEGHKSIVRLLLDSGACIDYQDKGGNTALWEAARGGQTGVVKVLLERKADLTICNDSGETPFGVAARKNHAPIVSLLQAKGAAINACDFQMHTPLMAAAMRGFENVVKLLLAYGAAIHLRDCRGQTAVSHAAREGHTAMVRLMLDYGASHDTQDCDGRTAISHAAENGRETTVQLLLDYPSSCTIPDHNGVSPLSWAAERGYKKLVKLFVDRNPTCAFENMDTGTALLISTIYGETERVKPLLSQSPPVNFQDRNGRTPLSWAAELGHHAITKLLLEYQASVDLADNEGRTPLAWAATRGDTTIMSLLLDWNATIDRDICPPLLSAVRKGHRPAAVLLLDRGANINIHNGETPLVLAARMGHETIVKQLLDRQAVIESRDSENDRTALLWAAKNSHPGIVRLLLDRQADTNAQDRNGRTALLWAASSGHEGIVTMLLQNNAAIDTPDIYGATPLWWAESAGHVAIAELFERVGSCSSSGTTSVKYILPCVEEVGLRTSTTFTS